MVDSDLSDVTSSTRAGCWRFAPVPAAELNLDKDERVNHAEAKVMPLQVPWAGKLMRSATKDA